MQTETEERSRSPASLLAHLSQLINDRTAHLAVIGLGYVGLAVACEFARAGFNVLGVELRPERVRQINQGESPIQGNEPGLSELLSQVIASQRLRSTTDYAEIGECDIILIAVETPVRETGEQSLRYQPNYEALCCAITQLGTRLKKGALVIVESTTAPGTLHKIVHPLLEESSGLKLNQDFYLGNCPERVMPGRLLANLRQVKRVVGGMNHETAQVMAELYRCVVQADLELTDCLTAELVKTVENAYRDVQIAFANEVALICEAVGGDVWEVRSLVNQSPYRQMHLPGAGVGGHCIPKDPWLLASSVAGQSNIPWLGLRMIPSARQVNDFMPLHMFDLLSEAFAGEGYTLPGARVLVMGYAYLENSDDTRNSPSALLVKRLVENGATPVIHDPYIPEYQGDLLELAKTCDAAVVMVRHQPYQDLNLADLFTALRKPVVIDGRNLSLDISATLQDQDEPSDTDTSPAAKRATWVYRLLGRSTK